MIFHRGRWETRKWPRAKRPDKEREAFAVAFAFAGTGVGEEVGVERLGPDVGRRAVRRPAVCAPGARRRS